MELTSGARCPGVCSSAIDFVDLSGCASFAADSRQIKAQEVVAGDRTGALGHLERAFWNSGRNLYQHVFRSIFAGMKLTQRRPRFYKQTHCEVESALSEGSSKAGSKSRLTPLRISLFITSLSAVLFSD